MDNGRVVGENVILTGFMGTGKTTAGRLLAEKLSREFIDTDAMIAGRAGQSIAEIFSEQGEARFRRLERELAAELAGRRDLVIATGGRMMLDSGSAALLGATGPVFCLSAEPDHLVTRLANDGDPRPLLTGDLTRERIAALLQSRAAGYARFRDVDTSGRTVEEVVESIRSLLDAGLRETLQVRHPDGVYDVVIGDPLLPDAAALARIEGQAAILTDDNVGPRHAARIQRPGEPLPVLTMPAGEQHKTLDTVRAFYDGLLATGMGRDGTIIGLGGGVAGDVAGFVAATYLRGIDLVLCPTSLLSMVDASIGGKTGVDLPQGKNLVGAFKHPRAVLADISTLTTLPAAEFRAGLAEVAKHGLIADPVLWQRLMAEDWRYDPSRLASDRLLRSDLQTLIARAVRVKREVVEEDPHETGRRAVLNLGHTFAHAIEQASGYAIRHGEAVAIGLAAAARLSAALGECPPELPEAIETGLVRLGLPVRIPAGLEAARLFEAMAGDKKKQGGRLRFILIHRVGDVFVHGNVPRAAVMATLEALT